MNLPQCRCRGMIKAFTILSPTKVYRCPNSIHFCIRLNIPDLTSYSLVATAKA